MKNKGAEEQLHIKEMWQLNVMCNPGRDPGLQKVGLKILLGKWWNFEIYCFLDKEYCITVKFPEFDNLSVVVQENVLIKKYVLMCMFAICSQKVQKNVFIERMLKQM